jgi:hypothetical protein
MKQLSYRGLTLSVLVLAVALLGCGGTSVDPAGATQIELEGSSGSFSSGLPAQLIATFGSAPCIELGFMAQSGAGWITFDGQLSMADIDSGVAALSLTTVPLEVELATVQLGSVNGAPDFGTGTVQLQLSAKTIAGSITSASDPSPWMFTGTMVVGCSVPESEVGPQSGTGTGGADGSEVLLDDPNFTTSECAPFRALAGR